MAWVAVDKDGKESIHQSKPVNESVFEKRTFWWSEEMRVNIPSGSIKKLIGRELTWKDEPVELKESKS